MAKRLTDTEIWDKEWFMKLKPALKCAAKFIRDKCDISGIWSPNYTLLIAYIGEPITEQEILSIDDGKQFIKMDNGKIFCFQFIEFQNGELLEEHELSPERKQSPIHKKILSMLKINALEKKKDIGYVYPINMVLDRAIVIVEEKVRVIVEEKEKKPPSENIIYPFSSEVFLSTWKKWLKYRKDIKKPYKSELSVQSSLKNLSKYDEKTACEMIEVSISNGWQGLFELRDGKPKTKNEKKIFSLKK